MFDPRLRRPRRQRRLGLKPGADTASGGGTTVRVGGIDQSDYLLAYSLTLRLGSFDFTLINPATVPVVGNMVYLLEPAWDGQVVSVSHKDVPRGTDKFYTITATNAKVATTSAAPFALSDVADSVTSFPYRDLTITTSRTDSGNKTQGTFTTWQQGLWPGMTFSLTSANFGLSAQTYAISNVTVTWPVKSTVPEFSIEFGDALLGLTQLAVNTGGLSTNPDGTTDLRDPLGNLIFNSRSGFGSAWRRFLMSGVYNGDWAAGPPDPANVIIDVTNSIPSWTFLRIGGTGINATWVSDPAQGSGRVLRFTMAPGVADDEIVLEQLVPINASRNQAYAYRVRAYFFNGSASASPGGLVTLSHQYMRADGSTTTGALATNGSGGDVITAQDANTDNSVVPADAYFIRVRVGMKRDTALVGTTAQVDLAEVRLEGGIGTALFLADDTDPTTYGLGRIAESSGVMTAYPGYPAAASAFRIVSTAKFRWGGATFPASPTTNDLYYRTDLDLEFAYDGTRWLSTTLYHDAPSPGLGTATNPFSANFSQYGYMTPWHTTFDLWLEDFWTSTYVATTNSGTNFWSVLLVKYDSAFAGTTVVTRATSGDTVNVLTTGKTAIGALLTPATYRMLSVSGNKTLSPGNLTVAGWAVSYRLVGV